MWWRQLRGWRGSVPSRMRSAERATSRWKPTASARRQKPAKRPCLAGGSPRSSRARFFTSWKARVASGPQRPDSSNAKARKVCFPGSTSGAYCWRFSASRSLAAALIDSYVRCASTLEKHPASVVVTSRSNVRPRSFKAKVEVWAGVKARVRTATYWRKMQFNCEDLPLLLKLP